MINKDTNDFMDKLAQLINNSGLPPVIIRLALDSAREQVAKIEQTAINKEIEQQAETKKLNADQTE